jgi:heme A synthase
VPDAVTIAAALTLLVAAGAALAAERPPAQRRRWWRFPVVVVAVAMVNIGLSVAVLARPAPVTGAIQLGCAVLLVYAAHRRAHVIRLRPAPRRRAR